MSNIQSVQFITDDGECISVFIQESLAEIDDDQVVYLQVPVFADDRSGHIVLTSQEVKVIEKSPLVREALRWALSTRATR